MALVSDLVECLAECQGVSSGSLTLMARLAREAGHLSQAGRGRGAAKATAADAAKLFGICALTENPKDAVEAIEICRSLMLDRVVTPDKTWTRSFPKKCDPSDLPSVQERLPAFLSDLASDISLTEALERFIQGFCDNRFLDFVLSSEPPPNAFRGTGYQKILEQIAYLATYGEFITVLSSFGGKKSLDNTREKAAIAGFSEVTTLSEANKRAIVLRYVNARIDEWRPQIFDNSWGEGHRFIRDMLGDWSVEVSVFRPSHRARISIKRDTDILRQDEVFLFEFGPPNQAKRSWGDRATTTASSHLTFLKIGRLLGGADV